MHIEAYTAGAVVRGAVGGSGGPADGFDGPEPLSLTATTRLALEGGPPDRRPRADLEKDDLLVIVPDDADLPIHASWHPVVLEVGPYEISGELPTQPGFDPGRALTRPGGTFVALRALRIALRGRPDAGVVERPHGLVNRYAVETVAADLELGFHFPGARFLTSAGSPLG